MPLFIFCENRDNDATMLRSRLNVSTNIYNVVLRPVTREEQARVK